MVIRTCIFWIILLGSCSSDRCIQRGEIRPTIESLGVILTDLQARSVRAFYYSHAMPETEQSDTVLLTRNGMLHLRHIEKMTQNVNYSIRYDVRDSVLHFYCGDIMNRLNPSEVSLKLVAIADSINYQGKFEGQYFRGSLSTR